MLVLFCLLPPPQENRKQGHELRVKMREGMLERSEIRYEVVICGSEGRDGAGKGVTWRVHLRPTVMNLKVIFCSHIQLCGRR